MNMPLKGWWSRWTPGAKFRHSRCGFTLVEVLVVVGILALLLAITVPAVMRARETAARASCLNNLRQIGVALSLHQEHFGFFPSAAPARRTHQGHKSYKYVSTADPSGLFELLPFLEQMTLYNATNLSDGGRAVFGTGPENSTCRQALIGTFLCSSDRARSQPGYAPVSYRFNVGAALAGVRFSDEPVVTIKPGDYMTQAAAFQPVRGLAAAEYTDGLSVTAGICERVLGSESSFDARRDFVYTASMPLLAPEGADQLASLCSSVQGTPPFYSNDFGHSWMGAGYQDVLYNHVLTPGSPAPDCTAERKVAADYLVNWVAVAPRSLHGGGANCLTMDGAVHFIRSQIHPSVWRALGTRSGGEAITAGAY
ncbi:MAG: DUF1559 domain-containing protein [Isosphaeraceae bacterium]